MVVVPSERNEGDERRCAMIATHCQHKVFPEKYQSDLRQADIQRSMRPSCAISLQLRLMLCAPSTVSPLIEGRPLLCKL